MKALREEGRRGMLADDPSLDYLLGFEKDKVESRPVKTYIRRLWLAFQSSKHSSMPRCFLDPRAETFSKEVEAQVSGFVEDLDHLASEIAKDPLIVDEKTKESRSAFQMTLRVRCLSQENGEITSGGTDRFAEIRYSTRNRSGAMTRPQSGREIKTCELPN
jgi:hypothetical protein